MISKDKEIIGIIANNKIISKVITAGKVVWEVIRSCFGSGYWINDRPWINNNGWRNG